jgi:hypothetical protein
MMVAIDALSLRGTLSAFLTVKAVEIHVLDVF